MSGCIGVTEGNGNLRVMPRPIHYRARSAHRAADVYAAMVSRDVLEARLAALGGKDAALLEHSADADEAHYRLRHGLAADQLPPVARALLPNNLVIERSESWRRDGEGLYSGEVRVTMPGNPGQVNGGMTLAESGGGSELVIEGRVEISVPLIGGKIEEIVAAQVCQLLSVETDFALARVRT